MRSLVAALCVLAMANTWAAIGTVADNKGTACEIQRGKTKLPGLKGAAIESMDTYTTGACVVNIVFRDDTRVRVTENSRLLIDDFVFDPKASDAGRLAMKVGAGTVRYASGQIAKNNPQRVNIQTPTAAIAVRGTDFNMTVDETGSSLVILVPSCKSDQEVMRYEMEEQRCRVGSIEVTTLAGTVVLNKAFEATFVMSSSMAPTPPVVLNTTESKINNTLIIVKPAEVQRAIRESSRSRQDQEQEEMEAEAQRRLSQMVKESEKSVEKPVVLQSTFATGKPGCNPAINVCVAWERKDADTVEQRGRGIAYRSNEEHYAEVKTAGHASNTHITIIHNDQYADAIIGDGSPGGNIVYIKQNSGVLKRQ